MSELIIIICIGTLFLFIGAGFAFSVYKYIKRLSYIKNFSAYVSVLEYHMEKSYDMIHKDRILVYSLEAFRLKDDEYQSISEDFVRLVRKFIGPTLLNDFIQLYGDEDSFIFILLDYFSKRYEDDEIRSTAMDNLTQEE